MTATIDAAGRIVVPKALRDALGLKAGMRLQLTEHDGALLVQPAPVSKRLVRRGKGVAIEADEPLGPLSASDVRAVLESGRR
jgi:AbrB family looped-hinge helix DNA binding protein